MEEVYASVCYGLQNTDDKAFVKETNNHKLERVAPLSVVRCSRGGKSRALLQIANLMKGQKGNLFGSDQPVVALYVSFNDYTSLDDTWEQDNPLQVLLRRVAFLALRNKVSFGEYMRSQPVWNTEVFLNWLGDTPCVLLIDELNNLDELTKRIQIKLENLEFFSKGTSLAQGGAVHGVLVSYAGNFPIFQPVCGHR
jgi:hypothetical protein